MHSPRKERAPKVELCCKGDGPQPLNSFKKQKSSDVEVVCTISIRAENFGCGVPKIVGKRVENGPKMASFRIFFGFHFKIWLKNPTQLDSDCASC